MQFLAPFTAVIMPFLRLLHGLSRGTVWLLAIQQALTPFSVYKRTLKCSCKANHIFYQLKSVTHHHSILSTVRC